MKVDGRDEAKPARPASEQGRFQEALKKTGPEAAKPPIRGGQAPRPPTASTRGSTHTLATQGKALAPLGQARTPPRGAYASTEHLGQVRQGMNVEAHRLGEVRGEALQTHQEQVRQRVTDLLARELAREPRAEPVPSRSPDTTPPHPEAQAPSAPGESGSTSGGMRAEGPGGAQAAQAPSPEARVQATLELIEKIDVFVKSQRPALAMRVGGALNATVEVERTGAREVALRIQGHRGPLPQEELSRIRDALAARGLKLRAFLSA